MLNRILLDCGSVEGILRLFALDFIKEFSSCKQGFAEKDANNLSQITDRRELNYTGYRRQEGE